MSVNNNITIIISYHKELVSRVLNWRSLITCKEEIVDLVTHWLTSIQPCCFINIYTSINIKVTYKLQPHCDYHEDQTNDQISFEVWRIKQRWEIKMEKMEELQSNWWDIFQDRMYPKLKVNSICEQVNQRA